MFRFISMAILCVATLYCSFANQRHWSSDVHVALFFVNLCKVFVCVCVCRCRLLSLYLHFSLSLSFFVSCFTFFFHFQLCTRFFCNVHSKCWTQTPPHAISLLRQRHWKSNRLVWKTIANAEQLHQSRKISVAHHSLVSKTQWRCIDQSLACLPIHLWHCRAEHHCIAEPILYKPILTSWHCQIDIVSIP